MGQVLVTESNLHDIANAIRGKNGLTETYTPAEMATAISSIPVTGVILKRGILRPDAVLVRTWSYDKMMYADEGIKPKAYTTTLTTVKASAALTPTETLDLATYDYYVAIRMATIPTYNITTKAKGRQEYSLNSAFYEITRTPANTIHALIDTSKYYTSAANVVHSAGNLVREVYYSSGTAITYYTSAGYGYNQTVAAPTLSSGTATSPVLTVNSPTLITRGSTTYFVKTFMNAVTDVRYQYIIELWRAPKNNFNLDGWGLTQQWLKMCEDIQSTGGTLT